MKGIRINKSRILITHCWVYGSVLKGWRKIHQEKKTKQTNKWESLALESSSDNCTQSPSYFRPGWKDKGKYRPTKERLCQASQAKETGPRWSPVEFFHLLGWAELLPFACICQCKKQNLSHLTLLLLPPPPPQHFQNIFHLLSIIS